jgi:uncharacterized protein YbjT (DUF2867 family)
MLVTGATGYVGGRLLQPLLSHGFRVRCLARRPDQARARLPAEVEVVGGDTLEFDTLPAAFDDVDTAFYLVHALGSGGDLWRKETRSASNFARAADEARARRVVYLGGLGESGSLSPHLATRQEVGRILRSGEVPALEFQASIILGSGSLSFEMIRALVERLPVMVTPRWVKQRAQPIAIEDVIRYLIAAIDVPLPDSMVVEIGGADRASYLDLLREYARQRGLGRVLIPVPVLTPRLSSLWLHLVTPLYAQVGRRLIESVRSDTVVTTSTARDMFPEIHPRGVREAIRRALSNEDREFAETHWSDSKASGGARDWHGVRFGWRRVDSRAVEVDVPAERAFAPIARIGGTTGWYFANALWRLRGLVDLVIGGVRVRRGPRHVDRLSPGDTLDCWRVEALEPNRLLRLRAEMKLPGRAWLQFEVTGNCPATVRQTVTFDPVGTVGLLYWYSLYPVHALMLKGLLAAIADEAADGDGKGDARARSPGGS